MLRFLVLAGLLVIRAVAPAAAQTPATPESEVDPKLFQIDEKAVLGAKVDAGTTFVDENGREFRISDMLGQPVVLLLSYYTCDGSCSVINANLRDLVRRVKRVVPGKDFRILTASFDEHDTRETLIDFRRRLDLKADVDPGWTFGTFKDPSAIKRLTDTLGYKFFWSPRDRTFFHPGVFLFLSGEGRLIRVLYALNSEPEDVELAVLDAKQDKFDFRPKELVNFAVSLCYSYNYAKGRYTFNIPLIVAAGSLTFGLGVLSVGAVVFRVRKSREVV